MNNIDHHFLSHALIYARKALQENEVPVGAIVVYNNRIIGRGYNKKEQLHDTIQHAEIRAIQQAERVLGDWRLTDCTLYSTLEPCLMCTGAILQARLSRVVYGALDHKWGGIETQAQLLDIRTLNHRVAYTHYPMTACKQILSDFFKQRRQKPQLDF